MGMFDNLRISPDMLPITAAEKVQLAPACEGGFQTKSVVSHLTTVEITDTGKLRWKKEFWEDESPVYQPLYGPPAAGTSSVQSAVTAEDPDWVEENYFTGEVRFSDQVNEVRYEFCALFAEGELLRIVKVSP